MNDLISRQATIEDIVNTASRVGDNKTLKDKYDGAAFRQHEIIDIIESLPPAQQWIPVEERLPEPGKRVIVTYERTYSDTGRTRRLVVDMIYSARTGWNDTPYIKTVAWMPLPDPYKGEE